MTDELHIAHFTNTYKPNVNGVVRSVSTFREALTRMGNLVFIFGQDADDYEDTEPFVFRYPAIGIPGFDYSASVPASNFVNKLLPSLKLDVIHSNHPNLIGTAAANKAKDLDLPLVFTFHTNYVEYGQHYVPFGKAFVEDIIVDALVRYIRRCQHVVTPSDSIKQYLEKYGGITERVTTVPTGIDPAPFQQADGGPVREKYGWGQDRVLISIGRLTKEKNWGTLLSAVGLVARDHSNVRLAILGDGPQRKELEEQTRSLGIAKNVVFTGLVPFENVPNYLKAADLFCFASVTETQGLVTMEAMAAGLPVVAVDAPGTHDEITHGQQGLLTENDSQALAQAIDQVLQDESLYRRLKAGATEKAKSLDMMIQAKKMVDVYEQAIEDKKANRFVEVRDDRVKAN
jgi:glycosyltransferase involved in cell wall biosynthesis